MNTAHNAIVLVDLGFGDAGKGTLTDALARRYDAGLVVRYNGGAQAAHAVVTAEGRDHIFHQFGSGTLIPDVATLLSRHMLVNPLTLFWEEQDLQQIGVTDTLDRLYVARNALLTTPYHVIANRLREYARGDGRHGSCGLGIGETVADTLQYPADRIPRMGDMADASAIRCKLIWHRDQKRAELSETIASLCRCSDLPPTIAGAIADLESDEELETAVEVYTHLAARLHLVDDRPFLAAHLRRPGCTIFEGAQGILLDQDWGFHPHTTWSDTTPANAFTLLRTADFTGTSTVLGILRAYHTRHGAGPFPTEDPALTAALPDPHNPSNPWQGDFRAGWLDLSLARYALQVAGHVDALAFTCLDQLSALDRPKCGIGYHAPDGAPFTLLPGARECLEQREALGIALRSVTVTYRDMPSCPECYAAEVAAELRLPLAITSWGATAADKRFEK